MSKAKRKKGKVIKNWGASGAGFPYIRKRKIKKRRKYNVWQSPYNKELRKVEAYINKYGDIALMIPEKVENPTLDDLETLKRIHEANKAEVKEVRTQRRQEAKAANDKYEAAKRAIQKVLARVESMMTAGWETEKYEHAESEAQEAILANEGNEEWAEAVLRNTSDIFLSLKNFVFMSKQTWDSNTIHESTAWWDMFFEYIWGL